MRCFVTDFVRKEEGAFWNSLSVGNILFQISTKS